jgi:hypothetical protein
MAVLTGTPSKRRPELKTSRAPPTDLKPGRPVRNANAASGKESVMKRFVGCLVLVLGTVLAAASCNGANDVTGLDAGKGATHPSVTPRPRPTPNPCGVKPADCDELRSEPRR